MKIQIKQTNNEMKNEFEIKYNDILKYKAKLPFISIDEPLGLEKIRNIKILDLNDNEIYTTDYQYIENLKEEFIPLKYLVTGSQKFNQLLFISNSNTIKIYVEANGLLNSRYVIEINEKKYFCYSVEDGYIRHLPIYDDEMQIGEALKSNININEKDEYFCYLKEGYETLSDGIVALLLFLDRNEYSSSYIVMKSYSLYKKYSYDKTNKFYNKEWVINNFGDEFYKKVDNDAQLVKEKLKLKNYFKTQKELWNSMSLKEKRIMKFVIVFPFVFVLIIWIIIMLIIHFK